MVRLVLQVLAAPAGGRASDPIEPVEHPDQDQGGEQQADRDADVAPGRGLRAVRFCAALISSSRSWR